MQKNMGTSKDISNLKNQENGFDVHAFADDQLDPHTKEQIFLKLTENPKSFSEYLFIVKIKQILQKYSQFHPHFMLWAKIKQHMNAIDKQHQKKQWFRKLIWATSSLFVLAFIFAGFYYRSREQNSLDARILATTTLHLAPIAAFHLSEPVATKDWIDRLLGQPLFYLPEDLKLKDTTTGIFDKKRVFQFNFEDSKGAIRLLVISNISSIYGFHREIGHKNFGYFQMNHLPSIIWIHDQNAFVLSGEKSLADLELIAFKMRKKF